MYGNLTVLKETRNHERRIALVPHVAAKLAKPDAKMHQQPGTVAKAVVNRSQAGDQNPCDDGAWISLAGPCASGSGVDGARIGVPTYTAEQQPPRKPGSSRPGSLWLIKIVALAIVTAAVLSACSMSGLRQRPARALPSCASLPSGNLISAGKVPGRCTLP